MDNKHDTIANELKAITLRVDELEKGVKTLSSNIDILVDQITLHCKKTSEIYKNDHIPFNKYVTKDPAVFDYPKPPPWMNKNEN